MNDQTCATSPASDPTGWNSGCNTEFCRAPNGTLCRCYQPVTNAESPYCMLDTRNRTYGHVKGFLVFDASGGVWVTHSQPGFPLNSTFWREVPEGGDMWIKNRYSQNFACYSLPPEGVNAVARILEIDYPYIQEASLPRGLRAAYGGVAAFVDNFERYLRRGPGDTAPVPTAPTAAAPNDDLTGVVVVATQGDTGSPPVNVTVIGKAPEWGREFWAELAAPTLRAPLVVETWCNIDEYRGPANAPGCPGHPWSPVAWKNYVTCCVPSACDQEYPVEQIEMLNFSLTDPATGAVTGSHCMLSNRSHAKWGLSKDPARPWVCWGDLNRQVPQYGRGGGAACVSHAGLWSAMTRSAPRPIAAAWCNASSGGAEELVCRGNRIWPPFPPR